MKKLFNILIILSLVLVTVQCKKKTQEPEPITCSDNTHWAGTYVCTNNIPAILNDTIQITFNNMDSNCNSNYTIKGFDNVYNHVTGVNGCASISNSTHQIIGNIVTICNAKIYDNVWSNNGITNDNDISILLQNCNGNQLNFKKIN